MTAKKKTKTEKENGIIPWSEFWQRRKEIETQLKKQALSILSPEQLLKISESSERLVFIVRNEKMDMFELLTHVLRQQIIFEEIFKDIQNEVEKIIPESRRGNYDNKKEDK